MTIENNQTFILFTKRKCGKYIEKSECGLRHTNQKCYSANMSIIIVERVVDLNEYSLVTDVENADNIGLWKASIQFLGELVSNQTFIFTFIEMNELRIQFEEERESECGGSPLSIYCAKCLFKVLCETRNRDQIKRHTDNGSVG